MLIAHKYMKNTCDIQRGRNISSGTTGRESPKDKQKQQDADKRYHNSTEEDNIQNRKDIGGNLLPFYR